MAETLRERCERRLTGLKAVRAPHEPEWREIAQYCKPNKSRFLSAETNKNFKRRNSAIYSSYGIRSFRTLASGMYSGLSSPSRPWKKLRSFDDELMADQEVKVFFSECDRLMDNFLASTNFYEAAYSGYGELGLFGTEACVMTELHGQNEPPAVCDALTVGEYWLGVGSSGKANALYRRCDLTVAQTVESFGLDKVSQRVRDAYDRSNYEQMVYCIQAIEPNDEQNPNVLTAKGKPWRSAYWDTEDGDKQNGILRESGFETQPFWAPRWDTTGGDVYGSSPGSEALPDLRELQLHTKKRTQLLNFMGNPEKIVPPAVKLNGEAGHIVSAASVDAQGVVVPFTPDHQVTGAYADLIARLEDGIDRTAFNDVFMAITQLEGSADRTVPEINARLEEKMTQLGPVIERVNNEKLAIVIDRAWDIMLRKGMLPPAPEALSGLPVKVEFVSVLAQAQRKAGISDMERVVSFIGNLAGAHPDALDKLNIDETVDEYAALAGADPKIIRSDEEVRALRDARKQTEQAQQMASMMPAAKDGADAARLLSEAAKNGGIPGMGMAA